MGLQYKIDVLSALRSAGFSSYTIRKNNLLPQSCMTSLRAGDPISWASIESICRLLNCQPGDILEFEANEKPSTV